MNTEMSVTESLRTYRESIYSFIDFLDDRKDAFQSEINDILKIRELRMQQWKLNPREKYNDHLESEKLEQQILEMADNLPATKDIADKSRKLNIIPDHYAGVEIRNNMLIAEHLSLSTIDSDEVDRIISAKSKYVAFRKIPNIDVLFNGSFLHDLDAALYLFFEAFTDVSDMDWIAKTSPEIPETPKEVKLPVNLNGEDITYQKKRYDLKDSLSMIRAIFDVCTKWNIFRDWFTLGDLIQRYETADFSGNIHTEGNKTKIRVIIREFYRYSGRLDLEGWYGDAVESIGITKSECSKSLGNKTEIFREDIETAIKNCKRNK